MDPSDERAQVIVLEERPNGEFEPTEEEIRNYAEWLGLDLEGDTDLIDLAKEGLKAPLENGWKPCQNVACDIFYFNFHTHESSWDHPADEDYRKKVQDLKQKKRDCATGFAAVAREVPVFSFGYPSLETPQLRCSFLRRICCKRRPLIHCDLPK